MHRRRDVIRAVWNWPSQKRTANAYCSGSRSCVLGAAMQVVRVPIKDILDMMVGDCGHTLRLRVHDSSIYMWLMRGCGLSWYLTTIILWFCLPKEIPGYRKV